MPKRHHPFPPAKNPLGSGEIYTGTAFGGCSSLPDRDVRECRLPVERRLATLTCRSLMPASTICLAPLETRRGCGGLSAAQFSAPVDQLIWASFSGPK